MDIQIPIKANHNVAKDTMVRIRVTKDPILSNYVTLRFDNNDYCVIDVVNYRQVRWYLTTYLNTYAISNFIEMLKAGEISIEEGGKQ